MTVEQFLQERDNEKVLITFRDNCGDEFDVHGFTIMNKRNFAKWKTDVLKGGREQDLEIYFGTNEYLNFTSPEDFLNCCSYELLTEQEYAVISRIFGDEYAHGDIITRVAEHYSDTEDSEDEEWGYEIEFNSPYWDNYNWNPEVIENLSLNYR